MSTLNDAPILRSKEQCFFLLSTSFYAKSVFLPTTSFLDFCLFHLFDSQERGRRKREERGGGRTGQEEGKGRGKRELCREGRGEAPARCLTWRGVGEPAGTVVLLLGLALERDESCFEKEGCGSLLGSAAAHCILPRSPSCACPRARRPPAFRGSPHPPG